MPDEERLRSAVHDELMAGGDVARVLSLARCDKAQAQRIIDQVMADYVTELNRALASGAGQMYGVDASTFMSHYDQLGQAKRGL
jgi:hypothetical protein